jgi:hypothetical protein
MYIPQEQILAIEQRHNVIAVQSDFPEIIYAVGHGALWIINRQTGAELQIAAENVHAFADELMSMAEVHLGEQGLRKGV